MTRKINRILLVAATLLFALSAYSYRESVRRAERFERGQKFLQNLNPDSIAEIEIQKGDEGTRLRREGDRFVVVSAEGYPAKNEAVNRFIRDVLEIGLEKEVGSGKGLEEELELASGEGENTTEVTFKDANEKVMVHFLIGKAMDGGGGSYVRRADEKESAIYLTSSRLYLSTADDDFLKKEILDVEQAEIASIRGEGFVIEEPEEGAGLKLAGVPAGKKESTKVNQLKNLLSGLRFTRHHLADAAEVQGLLFDSAVTVDLKDGSGYEVAVASKDDKHYLQIQGFHTAGQLSIAVDADVEEVKETSEILARQDEIQKFNAFHGSWIYEVTETTANRVRVEAGDLVEDA